MAAMRDDASVSKAAWNRIQSIFLRTFNVVCFSHILNSVSNDIVIPYFLSEWVGQNVDLIIFALLQSEPFVTSNNWRWTEEFHKNSLMFEVESVQTAPGTNRRCTWIRPWYPDRENVAHQISRLWYGEPFVKAIYVLEENSSLVFSLLERFQAVSDACQARLSQISRRQLSQ